MGGTPLSKILGSDGQAQGLGQPQPTRADGLCRHPVRSWVDQARK